MKIVKVKYIGCSIFSKAYGQIHERILIETKEDLQEAWDNKIIGVIHLTPMKLRIANGDKIVLNRQGGWCTLEGTWELINEPTN